MEGALAIAMFFTTVVLVWGGIVITRHRERMTAMEKGLKPEDVRALFEGHGMSSNPLASLKWGIVFAAVGIAVLLSLWLHEAFMVAEGVYPGLIALFGGLGLILFYALAKKRHVQQS
jgi:hypothetical protein